MRIYTASYVLPVSGPPIADAAVAVSEGRIAAVGSRNELLRDAADAEVRELGSAVLLPGLVNAHTHLELSWMGEAPPSGPDYVGWLREFVDARDRGDEETAWRSAERSIEGVVGRGTVAIGDVCNEIWIGSVLARSPLHAVVFHELFGFPAKLAERLLAEAASRLDTIEADGDVVEAKERLQIVLTPHAAHSTSVPLLKALAGRAGAARAPLSIHVAESDVESRFLHDGSGPFREFLEERGAWDPAWRPPGLSPVAYLDRLGALSSRTLVVHCVHFDHQDLSLLQARGVTVVVCPRSNRRLGVGVADVPRLLASGIPVAVGTDSLATAPDLDLFAEMAALREEHDALAPAAVLRMATLNGARALGLDDRLGSIEVGKLAALAVVEMPEDEADPLAWVTSAPESVRTLEGDEELSP